MILTHDEVETIRIHMNAFKENLCNQQRYKEAEYYQIIVNKLDDYMTVESIPVEWIRQWVDRFPMPYAVMKMLIDWQAEQRKDNE